MSTITDRTSARRERTVELELRVAEQADRPSRLRGYAAIFNSPSEPLPFREVLEPGCFARALASEKTDVLLYWGHDRRQPLARQSAGNLRIWEDEKGLAFEATLPDTQLARDALTLVREGIVKQMSFGFYYSGTEREELRGNELWVYVSEVGRLLEISLVTEPAYTSTSVEARAGRCSTLSGLRQRASQAIERHPPRGGRLALRERSPYGPQSQFSWFRDLLAVTSALAKVEDWSRAGLRRRPAGESLEQLLSGGWGPPLVRDDGSLLDAWQRLRRVEQRDIGSAQLTGMVSGAGVPEFIVATYREAVRARAAVAQAISRAELPPGFIVPGVYSSGRLTTGASVDVQASEHDAVAETNADDTTSAVTPATIAGQIDLSRQLFERGTQVDVLIARELGSAYGERLDLQLVSGSGSSGELQGLLGISGITSTLYNDASPSGAEALAKIWQCASETAAAIGYGPTELLIMHPRRAAWLQSQALTAAAPFVLDLPGRVVEAAAVPTNLGAGTNEDRIIVVSSADELVLLDRAPEFRVWQDAAVNPPATIRASVFSFAALVVREPKALGVVSGTGLAGVSF